MTILVRGLTISMSMVPSDPRPFTTIKSQVAFYFDIGRLGMI